MVDRRRADTLAPLTTPTPRPRAARRALTPVAADPDPDSAIPVYIPVEGDETAPVSLVRADHDPGLDFEDPTKPAYLSIAARGAELRARAGRSKRPTEPLPLPRPPSNSDRER